MKAPLNLLTISAFCCALANLTALAESTNSIGLAIRSKEYDVRQQAITKLKDERKAVIHDLVSTLRGDLPPEIKQDAAKALGVLRAIEASEALVNSMELDAGIDAVSRNYPVPLQDIFPVSTALERIGGGVVPYVVEKISETDARALRNRCLIICVTIDGEDLTRLKLETARNQELDPAKKARLEAAVQSLSQIKAEPKPAVD